MAIFKSQHTMMSVIVKWNNFIIVECLIIHGVNNIKEERPQYDFHNTTTHSDYIIDYVSVTQM